jgi:3'(2'), 5'-bisphosphate nucleotidase
MTLDVPALLALVQEAGARIMAIYSTSAPDSEVKQDGSPLTAADRASHALLDEGLRAILPGVPVLSEEGRDIPFSEREAWERFWLVDPLDGTKEFLKRNGQFTVNVALVERGSPVFGVVYAPALRRLYWGRPGEGAWRIEDDGSAVAIRARVAPPGGLTVVESLSHPSPELEKYLESVPVAERRALGSSLKFCAVAEGSADLYPRLGPTMEWDTAASQAIVEAAGGTVLTLEGDRLRYNKEDLRNPSFVARGPALQGDVRVLS